VASMGSAPARSAAPRPRGASATGWLRAVLFRGRLDAQLAAGLDPQSDPALALRARQLIRARSRRRLARSVEHLVEEVDADRNWWLSAAVPFLRDQVVAARGTLTALAGALRDAEPISPRGVAITSRLITDPASPLYVRTAPGALQLQATAALDALLAGSQPWCELPAAPPLPSRRGFDGER
jgi:hypothetical protein